MCELDDDDYTPPSYALLRVKELFDRMTEEQRLKAIEAIERMFDDQGEGK